MNWYRFYKTSKDIFRGDTTPFSMEDYNPEHGIKSLNKDLASSMSYGPGMYFVSRKDYARLYGEHITKKTLQSANLINKNTPKLNYTQISNILKKADKEILEIAASNWSEVYSEGVQLLIKSIENNENSINQLMSIWADVFFHQNAIKYIELMVANKIDGLQVEKDDATYYVIYNKNILQ